MDDGENDLLLDLETDDNGEANQMMNMTYNGKMSPLCTIE
jgi:hypothetical protein